LLRSFSYQQNINERRLAMTNRLRKCAIALSLLGGVALLPISTSAGSIHDNGNFGGSWNRIGPSDVGYRRHHYGYRNYGYRDYGYRSYGYYAPRYRYAPYSYYAPYGYGYYGPGIGIGGPGFSIGFF
jgi:hypothetical protein